MAIKINKWSKLSERLRGKKYGQGDYTTAIQSGATNAATSNVAQAGKSNVGGSMSNAAGIVGMFKGVGEMGSNYASDKDAYGYKGGSDAQTFAAGSFDPTKTYNTNKQALARGEKFDAGMAKSLIGSFTGITGLGAVDAKKRADKWREEDKARQQMDNRNNAIAAAPGSQGGIPASAALAYGGYLTPAMLKKMNGGKLDQGNKFDEGGYPDDTDPVKKKQKRAEPIGVNTLSQSDLEAHRNQLKSLAKVYDPKQLGENSQYTMMTLPSQKYMNRIRETGNAVTSDATGKRVWDKKSNEVMGYISSSKEWEDKNTDFMKNPEALKSKIPFTETEFATNPDLYKHSLDGQTYDDLYKYVFGTNPVVTEAKAKGGYANPLALSTNSVYSYKGGGTHGQNPLGGIPIGKSKEGKQSSVEQGESSFTFPEGNYIFSNRLKLRK